MPQLILKLDKDLDLWLSTLAHAAGLSKCEMVRVCICDTIANWMAENDEKAKNDTTVANFTHESAHAPG